MKLDAKQKQYAMIAAAVIAVYLAYRWYANRQGTSTSTAGTTTAPDTASSDYASLAGQEQADAATLQGQNVQLANQETGDIQTLTSTMQGLADTVTGNATTEQTDVGNITTALGSITSTLQGFTQANSAIESQIAGLASGQQAMNRAQNASIQTHKGGPFYNYYVRVTGKAPPATVKVNNFIYQAWTAGVKAAALAPAATHNSAPKQTQVAHPNGSHTQKPAVKPTPAKKPPPPKTKPKASGVRR